MHELAGRKFTIHRVERPGPRPSGEIPLAAAQPELQGAVAAAALPAKNPFFLSATVVDNWATYLRWSYRGQRYAAWSNINFHHLTGFSEFRKGAKHFLPVLAVGNAVSSPNRYQLPATVVLGVPAFNLVEGDANNAAALELVGALHELYLVEGPRLREACQLREQRIRERQLAAQANPEPPKDIVLRYWKVQPKRKGLGR